MCRFFFLIITFLTLLLYMEYACYNFSWYYIVYTLLPLMFLQSLYK